MLAPLTDLRAAFDVRTGARTTLERLRDELGLDIVKLDVPAGLAGITRERHPGIPVNEPPRERGEVLMLNGRCPLALPEIRNLVPGEWLFEKGGDLLACVVDSSQKSDGVPTDAPRTRLEYDGKAVLRRPWDVKAFRDAALDADLASMTAGGRDLRTEAGVIVLGSHAVKGHASAKVYPGVVLDAEAGPIYLDDGATLRPACSVIGPAYIGAHSTVLDRAVIRPHTAVGPWCKVAGEIGGTIFQGYANKAHDGYLGDSWVGEWSNFGAGTTNSNLLNTYGEIVAKATAGGSNERTGQQFLGCIVGDHVKFAICTRIMTGSVVHTGTMWAAGKAVSGCVAPFSWVTDEGVKSFRLGKFAEIAKTVMGRRKVTASEGYLARVGELHALVVQ